jgi:hypothetical protein
MNIVGVGRRGMGCSNTSFFISSSLDPDPDSLLAVE